VAGSARTPDADGLILDQLAIVDVTSEQDGFPIENVFADNGGEGWRASQPGEQVIRLLFDQAVAISRIQLRFEEGKAERTQEFTLSWCSPTEGCREIVRQQWNFSPAGSTVEVEDYAVSLQDVSVLELVIKPDISSKEGIATLSMWRVGGRALGGKPSREGHETILRDPGR
jgi:hypothetical protein